jgi:Large eukaryotic DNA virus major capsid protein/Major capsid protein N-terminus
MYVALVPTTGLFNYSSGTTSTTTPDTCWLAERAISAVELTIGGQRIDKHYQTWFRLYAEVFLPESEKINYGRMTSTPAIVADASAKSYVYLPLLFFFNRNPGLFLPLIALQYHEVRLDFDLTPYFNTFFGTNSPVFEVWANYVYLDTEERRRFAQKGHEYLIEQVQHTGGDTMSASTQTIRLSYNHPVKELIWCYQNTGYTASGGPFNSLWNFSSSVSNVNVTCTASPSIVSGVLPHVIGAPHLYTGVGGLIQNTASISMGSANASNAFVSLQLSNVGWVEEGPAVFGGYNTSNIITVYNASAVSTPLGASSTAPQWPGYEVGPLLNFKLVLNGQDRFKEQIGKYFNQYQPYVYHSGTPYPGIYVYSFALQPEEHQPTGTCNFSRIDNAQVAVNMKASTAGVTVTNYVQKMFAVNYNILRIQSGMGGLAFSN